MVVFTCNHCGESLQKPRVEKHYSFTCRREKFLTCVDCFKDFRRDEYNVHTKCITEEERYSGKDFVQKAKKGEVKQESWMEMIKSILLHENKLSLSYKNLLNTISYYDNVPRKKAKFINFIKSSTGGRINISDIEGVWNIIEQYKNQNRISSVSNHNQINIEEDNNSLESKTSFEIIDNIATIEKENNSDQESPLKFKKRKRKANQEVTFLKNNTDEAPSKKGKCFQINGPCETTNGNVENNLNNEELTHFSFNDHILQILTRKQQISKNKLHKKILKKYIKFMGEITEERFEKKMNKKLKKMPNVVVQDNYVQLIVK